MASSLFAWRSCERRGRAMRRGKRSERYEPWKRKSSRYKQSWTFPYVGGRVNSFVSTKKYNGPSTRRLHNFWTLIHRRNPPDFVRGNVLAITSEFWPGVGAQIIIWRMQRARGCERKLMQIYLAPPATEWKEVFDGRCRWKSWNFVSLFRISHI